MKQPLVYGQAFLIPFGRSEDNLEPWLSIGSLRSDVEMHAAALGDPNKMGSIGCKCQQRSVVLLDKDLKDAKTLSVTSEKTLLDGQSVFYIDIPLPKLG